MIEHLGKSLFALGAAYLFSLLVGRFTGKLHLPRVTGYLLVGLAAGPSFANLLGFPALIGHAELHSLQVLSELALALIMLTIGRQFRVESLRRWGKRLGVLSATEILASFILVGLAIFFFNFFIAQNEPSRSLSLLQYSIYLGLFTGVIAIATAPAATLLVIREYESDGPVTDMVLSLIGLNNLVSIVVFNILTFQLLQANATIGLLLIKIGMPIVVGLLFGFGISVWAQKLETKTDLQLLILGSVVVMLGISHLWRLDIFLTCFIAGMTVTNASPKANTVFDAIKGIDYPLYVIFFVIAGASLHIEALSQIGLLGIVYLVMRTAGKALGCWIGARLGNFGPVHRRWLGYSMLAQAGVAIGLSQTLSRIWPGGGEMIQTLILGSVVVFEFIGPISVRHALVHSGEVPVLTLFRKQAPETAWEGLHHVLNHFQDTLGLPRHHQASSADDIMVQHIMRRNVETIREDMPFNELLQQISHSKYDRFPVVNRDGQYIGVLDYADIRDVLVEPELGSLVVARDLVKPEPLTASPDQTLGEMMHLFKTHSNISYLPVIACEDPCKLVGVISQNDVLATYHIPKLGQAE